MYSKSIRSARIDLHPRFYFEDVDRYGIDNDIMRILRSWVTGIHWIEPADLIRQGAARTSIDPSYYILQPRQRRKLRWFHVQPTRNCYIYPI